MLNNGYHQLPPGKIANAVTWLEIRNPAPRDLPFPEGVQLEPLPAGDLGGFLDIFLKVGLAWLWTGFLALPQDRQRAMLQDPSITTRVLRRGDKAVGLVQTEFKIAGAAGRAGDLEIAYLGLLPQEFGGGLGAPLIAAAINQAAALKAERIWLHTCNFDHPGAVAFYRRQGFRIYAQGFEIMDDPRMLGLLPNDSAPHVPLLEKTEAEEGVRAEADLSGSDRPL